MKKRKNKIDTKMVLKFLREAYGLKVHEVNFYQFRIKREDVPDVFFDWYHTTGSLVMNENGYNKAQTAFNDWEDLAIFITRKLNLYGLS